MRHTAVQLSKLKGRSLSEVYGRSRQHLTMLWDRLLGSMRGEMTDGEMLEELVLIPESSRWQSVSVDEVLPGAVEAMRKRLINAPAIPAMADRARIRAVMDERWPKERAALIRAADRAAHLQFDIFGLADLDFGAPINWRREPVSGKETALDHWSQIDYLNSAISGDKKVTWELNRHAHFVVLAQAYCLTGNETYAEAFVKQASSWMDQNPPEMGINWTSSLEVAVRSIAWIWALHLCVESRHLSAPFLARVFKYLISHANHIESYLSTYFSPNTHLTGEALGLFYLGTCFPEFRRAETWKEKGLKTLVEQLPIQVNADGIYFEQSSYYHRYSVDFYLHLLILGRGAGVSLPKEIERRLEAMTDYLVWITRPD
ncbi:MAG TPA: heparinase II/III family protein, partial [Blastocatellia bacterium]